MENSRRLLSIDTSHTRLVSSVASCLERHVLPGQHVVVALSGGIDSVSLLHALVKWEGGGAHGCQFSAFHVHHGISSNADLWDDFCRHYSAGLNTSFKSVRVTVERATKDGLEAAARRARHAVFAAIDADWIMLAHQRDDQAETLLFNLLRGTGLAGAAAMCERNGRLLRPLLSISRDEIECYAHQHCLEWIEDESNANIKFSRNFLRQQVFTELRQRFPAATKNLSKAAGRFAEACDLLDDLARLDLGADVADFPLSVMELTALSEIRARNVLRYLLAKRKVRIPSDARLRETLRQMLEAATDRHPTMVFGEYRLLRRRGWIYLEPAEG